MPEDKRVSKITEEYESIDDVVARLNEFKKLLDVESVTFKADEEIAENDFDALKNGMAVKTYFQSKEYGEANYLCSKQGEKDEKLNICIFSGTETKYKLILEKQ
jgi:hypothetical protein